MAAASAASAHGGEVMRGHVGLDIRPVGDGPAGAVLLLSSWSAVRRLARRSTSPRPLALALLGGWAVLTLSLVSPLHEAGERSFTLHMIEHELIMLVATLLLAASRAGGILAWGLPASAAPADRRELESAAGGIVAAADRPVTATVVQAVVMWAWHAPALFDRALDSRGWHVAQHLSFVVASLLFWSAMLTSAAWRLSAVRRLPVPDFAGRGRARGVDGPVA